ncbi:hypothetical protein GIB67_038289 [Kingdonia uniflora]|uniref:Uncharacterized protein n=1 Tax=Kingdonia uniflora TaxID=39325 RepID=A0A7J7KUI1_9MAGN|nr:hypothetical protein GIB67_038289 [Kingdonia uniflora]
MFNSLTNYLKSCWNIEAVAMEYGDTIYVLNTTSTSTSSKIQIPILMCITFRFCK